MPHEDYPETAATLASARAACFRERAAAVALMGAESEAARLDAIETLAILCHNHGVQLIHDATGHPCRHAQRDPIDAWTALPMEAAATVLNLQRAYTSERLHTWVTNIGYLTSELLPCAKGRL